jgi:hypothetical protein
MHGDMTGQVDSQMDVLSLLASVDRAAIHNVERGSW